jgi:hypothetical protein
LWEEIKRRHRENNLEKIRERDKLSARKRRGTSEYKEANAQRSRVFKDMMKARQIELAGRPIPELCELCYQKPKKARRTVRSTLYPGKLVFDHCHQTEKFRGWLCDRCNRVLGSVKDQTWLLHAMILYIQNGGPNKGETHYSCQEEIA